MTTLQVAIDARGAQVGAAQFEQAGRRITRTSTAAAGGVNKLDAATARYGRTATKTRRAMGGMLTAFVAFAGLRGAVNVIGDFEETVAVLGNVTGGTEKQMATMEATARSLGATTRFSATEAAEGMLSLARAGFDAEESVAAVGATLDLAQAGLLGLGEAAGFASNIVRQFNLDASETVRVADTLVHTANSANTDVRQLAEAMKFAGPVAASLGVDLETTAATIGALSDRGIQASLAGTNLRGVMLALTAPTDKIEKALGKMGLTFEQVDPLVHDFVDIMETLGDAQLDAATANEIFGRRNTSAALILSQNTAAVRELAAETKSLEDVAEDAADAMDNTLNGALFGLKSAIQEAVLGVGDQGLKGGLTDLTRFMTIAVRAMGGLEDESVKNNDAARLLGRGLHAAAVGALALGGVKLATWMAATAAGTRVAALAMVEFRAITLATAVTAGASGPLMAGLTAITGGLRALGLAVKGFFVSIGPAGWLILGIVALVEVMGALSRASKRSEEAMEKQRIALEKLGGATIDASDAAQTFENLEMRMQRAVERGDLNQQLQTRIGMFRALEDQIISLRQAGQDFDFLERFEKLNAELSDGRRFSSFWAIDDADDRAFFQTATIAVEQMRQIMGEGGQEAFNAWLEGFAQTDVAQNLNRAVPRPAPPPQSARDQMRGMARLRQVAAGMATTHNMMPDPGFGLEPDTFGADDVTRIPLTDALELLEQRSEMTEEQIESLREAIRGIAEAEETARAQAALESMTEGFEERARLARLELEAFNEALSGTGGTEEDIKAALRAANNEREVAVALAEARAQAAEDELELTPQFLAALESSVRAQQAEAEALEDAVSSREEAMRARQREQDQIDRAQASLDDMVSRLETEARMVALSAEERKVQTALMRVEALAYGQSAEAIEEYKRRVEAAIRATFTQKEKTEEASTALQDMLDKMRDENALLGMSTRQRAVAETMLRAENLAKREGVELTQQMADAIRHEAEERFRLENLARGTREIETFAEDIRVRTEALQHYGTEAEIAARSIEFLAAAERVHGEGSALAIEATENFTDALRQLHEMEELKGLAEDMGQAFGEAFTNFVTGASTAEEAAENLLRAISRLAVEQFATKPLVDMVSGLFGGLFGVSGGGIDPQELLVKQMEQTTATINAATAPLLQTAVSSLIPVGPALMAAAGSLQAAAAASGAGSLFNAKGNIFAGGSLVPFADGGFPGLITDPVTFPMSDGRRGVAGEAGPEWAIAPLERTPDGRLGASVKVDGGGGETYNITVNAHFHGVKDMDSFRRSKSQTMETLGLGVRQGVQGARASSGGLG